MAGNSKWGWGACGCCLGCVVVPLILVAVFGVGIFAVVAGMSPVDQAVERIRQHPAAIEALGTPIEKGLLVQGSVSVTGPTGNADMMVPVSGPKGSGKLFLVADKVAGEWEFVRLELQMDGSDERIDLLPPLEAPLSADPLAADPL